MHYIKSEQHIGYSFSNYSMNPFSITIIIDIILSKRDI